MFGQVKNFFVRYFWMPIANENVFYNPYNTLVYALIFAFAALYLVYGILKKLEIKVDSHFVLGVTPYIILSSLLRSSKDLGILNTFLIESPLIFFIMFGFAVSVLLTSIGIEKKFSIGYYKIWGLTGLISIGFFLSLFTIKNWLVFPLVILFLAPWLAISLLARYKNIEAGTNLAFLAQMFDGTVSFVAIRFLQAEEKHVLGNFLTENFGAWTMFPMKLIVVIPVLYWINKNLEGEQKNYILFIIGLLGLATGLRNLVTLICI